MLGNSRSNVVWVVYSEGAQQRYTLFKSDIPIEYCQHLTFIRPVSDVSNLWWSLH